MARSLIKSDFLKNARLLSQLLIPGDTPSIVFTRTHTKFWSKWATSEKNGSMSKVSAFRRQTNERRWQHSRHLDYDTSLQEVKQVLSNENEGILSVVIGDEEFEFPFVFLRDNCQCNQCWHPESNSRMLRMQELDPRIKPKEIQIVDGMLVIVWPDDHVSEFTPDWLKMHSFLPQDIERRKINENIPLTFWGSELQDNIKTSTYEELMQNDEALLNWILDLESTGLHLIQNAVEPGSLEKIGKRVAFLRNTNYGKIFHVKNKSSPSNVAYTGGTLGMHTDLAYYDYVPGMQMLHCIKQTPCKGGDNTFADGFHVAKKMEREYPDEYNILTTVPVVYFDIGFDHFSFHQKVIKPTISITNCGEIRSINHSNHGRHSSLNVPLKDVQPLYSALKLFDDLLYDPSNCIRHKLQPGEIACFHNYRVLHGRDGYETTGYGDRHLEGGYIDWDEMKSMRRVLQKKFSS